MRAMAERAYYSSWLPWAIGTVCLGCVLLGAIIVNRHPVASLVLGVVGVALFAVLLLCGPTERA